MTYITVHAQPWVYGAQFVHRNVRMRWGEDRNFSSFAGLWGAVVSTFQAGFIVAMKTEVRVNPPHRAGTTVSLAFNPLTKRTNTFD